jgi:hypothetical protein
MYECVVFARYLSLHPELTANYLATFHTQWAKVLASLPDAAKGMPEIHKTISAKVPAYATGKRVELEWSDKSTLKMAEEAGIPRPFHAWAFNYVSGLVHPSALFLIGHLSQETEGTFEISATNQEDEAIWALQLSHALILNAVELRLQYEPSVELQEGLNLCREDFEKIWGYSLPI